MKLLTPEERIRLTFLYDLVDLNYRGMRESAQIQRAALLHGCLPPTVIADMSMAALFRANVQAWAEIQAIVNTAPEPEPEPAPAAEKETIQ